MSAVNPKALIKNAGILEVANYSAAIPVLASDLSNAVAVKSALDALTYVRLASITDLKVSENYGDNVTEVIADDTGTVFKSSVPNVTVNGNWFEVGELSVIEKITGKSSLAVAASPVAVTTEIILAASSGAVAKGAVYVLRNKNGANTIVSSITVDVDGVALVANTDYTAKVDTDGSVTGEIGNTYITFLAATTTNKQVDVDYTYTPNASEYVGGTIENVEIPQLVVRITSTDSAGKVRVTYLVNAGFDGELVQEFVDAARAGNIGSSPFSFTGNRQGQILSYTDNV